MANPQDINAVAISTGGSSWSVLAELFNDSDFEGLLTSQERSLVNQARSNIETIRPYRDQFADIVSKYYGWKLVKDTNLNKLEKRVSSLSTQVEGSQNDLNSLSELAKLASGATVLVAYSEAFTETARKHGGKAEKLFMQYMISLVALLVVIWLVFFFNVAEYSFIYDRLAEDIRLPFSIGLYGLKAIALIFFFQISQFFRKSYNAEKHLEEVYSHRSDILQSLHAVYLAIDSKEEKDKILSAGALFAYERGETGYITTREGAGSGDTSAEAILGRIFKF